MIAVVHLVWGPLGPTRLREFLASYRRYPAGAEHDLILLLNNVTVEQQSALRGELDGIEHSMLALDEPVQDLAAYKHAAAQLPHDRLCFLNSYSVILAPDWLAKLAHALDQRDAGLVGATGSWSSLHSAVLNSLFLPNPYRGIVPKRSIAREEMNAIQHELALLRSTPEAPLPPPPRRTLWRSVVNTLASLPPMPEQLVRYPPFPSYHVRTNAFMIPRAIFTGLEIGPVRKKKDAYLLESGRSGMTSQIHKKGLRTLVVDRQGHFYDHTDWPLSNTLWQGGQEGLLIADNQTLTYTNGEYGRRRLLSALAWGPRAEPRPAQCDPSPT